MSWSQRRIEKIKVRNGAETYLEIGVNDGATFFNVDISRKDGVDPNFKFDAQERTSETCRLFEITSDAFWISLHPLASYDIVFIDGLHTFEQTLRDFVCSMRFSNAQTVWLIDDTVPSDVFSSLADPEQCEFERRKHGLSSHDWHGDVFKLVLFIHDFLPTLSYATIMNSGNPQTMVWQATRRKFDPIFNQTEAISRLTYFDVERLRNAFHFMEEAQAFDQLKL